MEDNDDGSTVSYCYYDTQMCAAGTIYSEETDGAEGLTTSEMTGSGMRSGESGEGWTDENWAFEDNLYPRLVSMDDTDAAYVSAAPVFLADGDTASCVTADFTMGTDNGVYWCSSDSDIISISGGDATVTRPDSSTEVTLTAAELSGVTKTVTLTVANSLIDSTYAYSGGDGSEDNPY